MHSPWIVVEFLLDTSYCRTDGLLEDCIAWRDKVHAANLVRGTIAVESINRIQG